MPQFVNVAPDLGINLVREMYGVNVIDYNGDGRLDLFFSNHNKHPMTLFEQQASGQMVDVLSRVGMAPMGDYHGASWGDCDNDGRPDLYIPVGVYGGDGRNPKLLYRQLANHTFTEVAASAGVSDPLGRGRASSWVDYDNDGDLDLLLNNMAREDNRRSSDKLFQNQGNCIFARVNGGDLTRENNAHGGAWADYDNDGDMDIFTTSDTGLALYRNNNGNFDDVTTSSGIYKEVGGAGMAWGDYDNDGNLDLFVTLGWSPRASNVPSTNRLYRNKGNGTFTPVETLAGVSRNLNSHHTAWADFDNDGDLDLYVTNAGLLSTGKKPNFLYMNKGDGTFEEIAQSVGVGGRITRTGLSVGLAVGDVNADGFLDIVLSNGLSSYGQGDGPNQLLLNQRNGAHWLQIKLVGQKSNRLGVGARAEVITSDGFRQVREMNGGYHYYSQNEMLLHFGFGQRTQISKVTIRWPSGVVQQVTGVAVDRRITVVESTTTTTPPSPSATATATSQPPTSLPKKVWLPWLSKR